MNANHIILAKDYLTAARTERTHPVGPQFSTNADDLRAALSLIEVWAVTSSWKNSCNIAIARIKRQLRELT